MDSFPTWKENISHRQRRGIKSPHLSSVERSKRLPNSAGRRLSPERRRPRPVHRDVSPLQLTNLPVRTGQKKAALAGGFNENTRT